MAGKWSGLRGAVPTAPIDADFQGRINAAKSEPRYILPNGEFRLSEIIALNPNFDPNGEHEFSFDRLQKVEKGRRYCAVRDEKDELEERIKKLNVELEALSQLLITDMEREGTDLFRLQTGESLSIKDEPYVSIANKDVFLGWIKQNNMEDLLTVHYMTMSSMTKDRLVQGLEPPPGLKVFLKQSITRRRARA